MCIELLFRKNPPPNPQTTIGRRNFLTFRRQKGGSSPWSIKEYQVFPNILCLLHCVPLYVCRLCINYQDLSTNLLGVAALPILLRTFISHCVIDFLSIRIVIIFSVIATEDRHPLWSRSIHQNAANCMTIRFRYIAQPRGVRKTYCARSRNDVRRLTSRSNGMPSKKIMESLEDVCSCRNCSKVQPNVSRQRRSLESSTLSC